LSKLTVDRVELAGKRVFLRVDFNVPLEDGRVAEDTRIRAALPTIELCLKAGAAVLLASHLGRPRGTPDPHYSLRPVAIKLEELLGRPVPLLPDCVGPEVEAAAAALKPGEVVLLENLRFHAEEEANDPGFARRLASLADVYVNDAFAAAHRAHASTEGIARILHPAAAGLLMARELEALGRIFESPERPFMAILGGAKVSDKLGLVEHLLARVDAVLIGGGMAYTFLKAQGEPIGKSLVEEDKLDLARQLLHEAKSRRIKFLLPVDHVVSDKMDASATVQTVASGHIPASLMALDIGPKTIELFTEAISHARTIMWNGPMGVFEVAVFAKGTFKIAHAVADNAGATSIVGGGDSVSAVHAAGVADKITHISTGGGASLEFLEGKKLPGVEALTDKK